MTRAPQTPCHGARNSPGASFPLAGGFYSRSAVLHRWNIEPGGATVDPGNQKEES